MGCTLTPGHKSGVERKYNEPDQLRDCPCSSLIAIQEEEEEEKEKYPWTKVQCAWMSLSATVGCTIYVCMCMYSVLFDKKCRLFAPISKTDWGPSRKTCNKNRRWDDRSSRSRFYSDFWSEKYGSKEKNGTTTHTHTHVRKEREKKIGWYFYSFPR